jgi:hypothetical protein
LRARPIILISLLIVVLVVNAVVLWAAMAPLFVTYAKVPTPPVACGTCSEPQVQRALAEAAAYARGEAASRIADMWPWWLLLVAVNIGAPVAAWRLRGSSAV